MVQIRPGIQPPPGAGGGPIAVRAILNFLWFDPRQPPRQSHENSAKDGRLHHHHRHPVGQSLLRYGQFFVFSVWQGSDQQARTQSSGRHRHRRLGLTSQTVLEYRTVPERLQLSAFSWSTDRQFAQLQTVRVAAEISGERLFAPGLRSGVAARAACNQGGQDLRGHGSRVSSREGRRV
jgi:hypothetical protein